MTTIKTLFANIAHAAHNGESLSIGGGIFAPVELRAAVRHFKEIGEALGEMHGLAREALDERKNDGSTDGALIDAWEDSYDHTSDLLEMFK